MKQLIKRIMKLISKFIEVKNIIVFESNPNFSDSSLAVYEEMLKEPYFNKQEFTIVWLVRKEFVIPNRYKNVPILQIEESGINRILFELRVFLLLSKAKYYFFTHRNFYRIPHKKNQLFVNLTHGTSFKNTRGKHANAALADIVLVSSPFLIEWRKINYNGLDTEYMPIGLPRNTMLNKNSEKIKKIFGNDKKIILWLPTYQNHKDSKDIILKEVNFVKYLDEDLDNLLFSNNTILLIKPHPAEYNYLSSNFFQYKNIKIIDDNKLLFHGVSLYNLLGSTLALLTDYSSVYIDYLLTDKPLGFVVSEQELTNKSKFIVNNPEDFLPGPIIENAEELKFFVEKLLNEEIGYVDKALDLKKLMHNEKVNPINELMRILMEWSDESES